MKKLEFNDFTKSQLVALYSIYSRDQTKLETRAAIRQNARILDKLEELLDVEPHENGGVTVRTKPEPILVLEIDDTDFEALHTVVKNYKPTNAEARVLDNLHKLFEKE